MSASCESDQRHRLDARVEQEHGTFGEVDTSIMDSSFQMIIRSQRFGRFQKERGDERVTQKKQNEREPESDRSSISRITGSVVAKTVNIITQMIRTKSASIAIPIRALSI